MTVSLLYVLTAVLVFAAIFITGRRLRGIARARNAVVLLAHKVLSLGAVALFAVTAQRVNAETGLGRGVLAAIAAGGVLFVGTMATGGWLSAREATPRAARLLHRILALFTVLVSALALYLLLVRA